MVKHGEDNREKKIEPFNQLIDYTAFNQTTFPARHMSFTGVKVSCLSIFYKSQVIFPHPFPVFQNIENVTVLPLASTSVNGTTYPKQETII